jgi:hypothetical protein
MPLLTDPEAYAVYAAILPNRPPVDSTVKRLVIAQQTVVGPRCTHPDPLKWPVDWRELLVAFYQNKAASKLAPSFDP